MVGGESVVVLIVVRPTNRDAADGVEDDAVEGDVCVKSA